MIFYGNFMVFYNSVNLIQIDINIMSVVISSKNSEPIYKIYHVNHGDVIMIINSKKITFLSTSYLTGIGCNYYYT